MWIKICGLTTAAAVSAALEMRVDALGFVFAESPRRLTPEFAARLARPARGQARCVAVTRHPVQAEIDEILAVFAPDVLQGDLAELASLRLPAHLERLPVLRAMNTAPAALPGRILFESAVSGAGIRADWDAAGVLARGCRAGAGRRPRQRQRGRCHQRRAAVRCGCLQWCRRAAGSEESCRHSRVCARRT